MGGDLEIIGAAEARSALAWWLEAGVDVAVQEEPRDWLKPAPATTPAAEPAASAERRRTAHETLAALQEWLASSPAAAGPATAQADPSRTGRENAAVMLLSDAPSLEDFAAGQPIGGEAWELATRMLAAIRSAAGPCLQRLALLLPFAGRADDDEERAACAEIARQHIALGQAEAPAAARRRSVRRHCSASALARPAAMSTRSKACAPSRPSTRAT